MPVHHALVLNLHQPPGNLEYLLEHQTWEAKEILFALDRIPRSLWGHEDLARVHLSLSGTLLETLSDPGFQERVYGIIDCGKLLWYLQNQDLIEVLGTGYYHPVLPLIPAADRPEHLRRWQGIARHLFWRPRFDGFWPPEMGFSMELIPLLRRFGYRYVMVDSEHVEPVDPMSWQELRYRPHLARYGEDEIIVVVRDRELSDAQESGMDVEWFLHEVADRTRWCDFPPLVTTATDGENGGWFRNVTAGANFWSAFYLPLLERIRAGDSDLRPTFIGSYLDAHGPFGEVRVATGAWNTGWHHGRGFTQWTGSAAQRAVIARYGEASTALCAALERAAIAPDSTPLCVALEEARWHLLRAETSCFIYWGEAWVDRAEADLAQATEALAEARRIEEQLARRNTPPTPPAELATAAAAPAAASVPAVSPVAAPTTATDDDATAAMSPGPGPGPDD
ncbi:MAG: glycoside hydrolase family 57 [Chromatiaceae bacterium]|nr:MAG: glycoside hydrolase family 57 [Chromatiaceae bacterium]